MKSNMLTIGAALAALSAASVARADTNLALTSDGASFVSASSIIDLAAMDGTTAQMQVAPISTPPVVSLTDGDTRYIFGTSDPAQTYTIKLAGEDLLSTFSATYGTGDRPISSFSVETSTDGVVFTPVVGGPSSTTAAGVATDTLTATAPVLAEYIQYSFGPASTQYGDGGSGVGQVTASGVSAAPEPSTWALMIVGVGMAGAAFRSRRHGGLIAASA